jgi:hypothetical protein
MDGSRGIRLEMFFYCAQKYATDTMSARIRKHIDGDNVPHTVSFEHLQLSSAKAGNSVPCNFRNHGE